VSIKEIIEGGLITGWKRRIVETSTLEDFNRVINEIILEIEEWHRNHVVLYQRDDKGEIR
jgi:hypothetical protein